MASPSCGSRRCVIEITGKVGGREVQSLKAARPKQSSASCRTASLSRLQPPLPRCESRCVSQERRQRSAARKRTFSDARRTSGQRELLQGGSLKSGPADPCHPWRQSPAQLLHAPASSDCAACGSTTLARDELLKTDSFLSQFD